MERIKTDVLIIGAGAAGLFAALHLPDELDVVVVDKGPLGGGGSSPWAQGGVAAALGPDDSPDLHAADTLRVAAGHGDVSAVAVLCSEAPECVMELAELGCDFARNDDGSLHLAREGGQSVARSVHSEDATGAAIMTTLRHRAVRRSDVHSFKDESILEIAADKSYRFASAYRDVIQKRERALTRAREIEKA